MTTNSSGGLLEALTPRTFDQAMQMAQMIANSELAPKDYRGKPENVIIAMQMGAELGLPAMQSIQNISVINGRPSVWGDAIPAIVKQHPRYEWMKESWDKETQTAYCTMKRQGEDAHTQEFSMNDAEAASLKDKAGPWKSYPKRMCQMRARGFCARDVFPDALKGISIAEEAMDIPSDKASPRTIEPAEPKALDAYPDEQYQENLVKWKTLIESGKKTATAVIATIESKYTLTESQKKEIEALEAEDADC